MKEELAKYRGKGLRYRRNKLYSRGYNPYRYNPYRTRPYRRTNEYEVEPSEVEPRYSSGSRYNQNVEKQPSTEQKILSREEFFERYPPSFPYHWNEDFRKEVMDRMYNRYVENAFFNAFKEKLKAEEKEKEAEEKQEGDDFKRDPQDRLLEVIEKKGIESPEGKAAYDELLKIQLKEINKLESNEKESELDHKNEHHVEESQSETESPEQTNKPTELSQTEVEQIMDQLEGELFNEPEIEPNEIEKAEDLAEQVEMDEGEIEDLVKTAVEETKIESSELGAELEPEYETEEEEDEVY